MAKLPSLDDQDVAEIRELCDVVEERLDGLPPLDAEDCPDLVALVGAFHDIWDALDVIRREIGGGANG